MKVHELITKLQVLVTNDPRAAERVVFTEGCDCVGESSGELESTTGLVVVGKDDDGFNKFADAEVLIIKRRDGH